MYENINISEFIPAVILIQYDIILLFKIVIIWILDFPIEKYFPISFSRFVCSLERTFLTFLAKSTGGFFDQGVIGGGGVIILANKMRMFKEHEKPWPADNLKK
jgi:hypothetical protein